MEPVFVGGKFPKSHLFLTPIRTGFLMGKLHNQRQQFLLTFFPDKTKLYEEKEVNGFILVKHIVNGDPNTFEIAIYPKDHFTATQEYKTKNHKKTNPYKKAHTINNSFNQQFFRAISSED